MLSSASRMFTQTWDIGYIIWKANTTNRGLHLKNTPSTLCLRSWGFHPKPFFSGANYMEIFIPGSNFNLAYRNEKKRNHMKNFNPG